MAVTTITAAHIAELVHESVASYSQINATPIPLSAGPICERCWMRRGIVCAVGGTVCGGAYRCGRGGGAR